MLNVCICQNKVNIILKKFIRLIFTQKNMPLREEKKHKNKTGRKTFAILPFSSTHSVFEFREFKSGIKIWWCFKSITRIALKNSFILNCSQITYCAMIFSFSQHFPTKCYCVLFVVAVCCKGQVRHIAIRNLSPHLSPCHKNRQIFSFVCTAVLSSKSKYL